MTSHLLLPSAVVPFILKAARAAPTEQCQPDLDVAALDFDSLDLIDGMDVEATGEDEAPNGSLDSRSDGTHSVSRSLQVLQTPRLPLQLLPPCSSAETSTPARPCSSTRWARDAY